MLSIRFDDNAEWWVSGRSFERLFQSALDRSIISKDLAYLSDVADANGGLHVALLDPSEGRGLKEALQQAARLDLRQIGPVNPLTEDGSYQVSLQKLLNLSSKSE